MIVKVAGVRHAYRVKTRPADAGVLAGRLAARFLESEKRDIGRVRQVFELAELRDCLVRRVLDYFGEELGRDCGHCDRCLGDAEGALPPSTEYVFTAEDEAMRASVTSEGHAALATPRQLARFFCGLSSPATSRTRPPLTRHRHFGALSRVPFARVLEFCGGGAGGA